MTLDLRGAVRDTWERALDEDRTVLVPVVVDRVIATYPDLYALEIERLGRAALMRWVKDLARDESDAPGQMTLFGLPAIIAVPVEDDDQDGEGFAYMRTPKAVWDEVQAGRALRVANVRAAQAKLDSYDGGMATLRPFMEGTGLTVAEAAAKAL